MGSTRTPVADNPLAETVTISNIDLGEGNSFSVTVKSEDTKVTNVYNINLNKDTEAEAKLTSVIFKDLDTGKLYEVKSTTPRIPLPFRCLTPGEILPPEQCGDLHEGQHRCYHYPQRWQYVPA